MSNKTGKKRQRWKHVYLTTEDYPSAAAMKHAAWTNLTVRFVSGQGNQPSRKPLRGPGSSIGIATGCWLDGPGIESQLGRDFPHLSRPDLGPTQPPVK
jgi:hypothetical protein